MNLEDLREMMDTDARKRMTAQEQTIKELHQKVADQSKEIARLRKKLETPT
jgi:uncharacterized coiled-coil protein SlyX